MKPKLRTDLLIKRKTEGGEVSYIIKDEEAAKYYRFGEREYAIFSLFNGERELAEIQAEYVASTGRSLSTEAIGKFAQQFERSGMLEKTAEEKRIMLLEKMRNDRQRKSKSKNQFGSILYMKFALVDPDDWFNRVYPKIRFLWTPGFILFSTICFILAALILAANSADVAEATKNMYSFEGQSVWTIFLFIAIVVILTCLHECAHGLTCKHFGGDVHDMGFLLLLFMPCLYANVSDAWLFEKRSQRLWVTFAGGYVELFIGAIATFIWWLTPTDTILSTLCYKIVIICSVSTLLFNFNPLIKLDGYYALVDYVNIPNLKARAGKYARGYIKKHIFRRQVDLPQVTRREHRILFVYGIASTIYITFMLTSLAGLVFGTLFDKLHIFAILPFGLIVYMLFGSKFRQIGNSIHSSMIGRQMLEQRKYLIGLPIATAVLLLVSFVWKSHLTITTPGILEPEYRSIVRAGTDGFVEKVLKQEGEFVRSGEVIARLRNDQTFTDLKGLQSRKVILRMEVVQAYEDDNALALKKQRELEQLLKEIGQLESSLKELEIRYNGPSPAIVLTPHLNEKVGAYMEKGEEFCHVAGLDRMLTRVPIPAQDLIPIEEAHQRTPGHVVSQIRPPAFINHPPFTGVVKMIAPASHQLATEVVVLEGDEPTPEEPGTRFDVVVEIPNESHLLRPGMTATIKIFCERRPVLSLIGRRFVQMIRFDRLF